MKCKCIEELLHNADLRDHLEKKAKRPVGEMQLDEVSFNFKTGEAKTFSTVSAVPVERKKRVTVIIVHSFCPFCGEKYE